ncbi:hypothetical protein ACFPRL_19145 [Pseudoclavibacter helvolus]
MTCSATGAPTDSSATSCATSPIRAPTALQSRSRMRPTCSRIAPCSTSAS